MRSPLAVAHAALALALGLTAAACDRTTTPTPRPEPPSSTSPAAPVAAREGAGAKPAAAGGAAPAAGSAELDHHFAAVEFPEVPIRPSGTTTVHVAWKTPQGTGVNPEAPFKVRWNRSDALAEAPADVKATGSSAKDGFDITVKPLAGAPNATLGGVIDLVVCDVATHSVCVPVRRKVEIEFVIGKAAAAQTTVTVDLPHAKAL